MSSNRTPSARALAALGLAGLALCACASHSPKGAQQVAARTPTEQYPLKATAHADEIRLDPHATGLSQPQIAALVALAERWQDKGGGELTIETPLNAADPRAADRDAAQARLVLLNAGAPSEMVRQISYQPGEGVPAAIVVGYDAHEAVIPQCGRAWENLANTLENKAMQNFGCAVTANMAAQIANPADISGPRASDPPDAGRQAFVIDAYRQSKPTAGAKDAQSSGIVSDVSSSGGGGSGN